MKTFKLHLVRHGLTQGNLDGIYVGGGLDMPLCEAGVDELHAMKSHFSYPDVNTLFLSPMKRALQSADILFPGAKDRHVLEDLRENRFGEFEGRSADELVKEENFTKWLDPSSGFVPEGGESGQQFAQRCAGALLSMMSYLATNGIPEAACVTHGGVIMSMLSQLAQPQRPAVEWLADNGAGFTVITSAAMLMRDNMVEAVDIVPGGYLEYLQSQTREGE